MNRDELLANQSENLVKGLMTEFQIFYDKDNERSFRDFAPELAPRMALLGFPSDWPLYDGYKSIIRVAAKKFYTSIMEKSVLNISFFDQSIQVKAEFFCTNLVEAYQDWKTKKTWGLSWQNRKSYGFYGLFAYALPYVYQC